MISFLSFPSASQAADVTLWVCHGPSGQPLGSAALVPGVAGDAVATAYGGGCDNAGGGVSASFSRQDPINGSNAGWQVSVPAGTTLRSVTLDRATQGFGGSPVPGDPVVYSVSTTAATLESASLQDSSNVALAGTATFAPTSGQQLGIAISCGQDPGGRCSAAPSGAGTAAVAVSSAALTVSDDNPPAGAVGGVHSPASGTLQLAIRASDDGVGLSSATASLDGATPTTVQLGGASCTAIGQGSKGVDLPLGAACPQSVTDVPIAVDTGAVPDGSHRLTVTVADAAGNVATIADQPIVVRNSYAVPASSTILAVGTGGFTAGGGASMTGESSPGGLSLGGPPFGGASGVGSGCASPQLSAMLTSRPLHMSRHGVPVLSIRRAYLFTGRLTCVVKGRRVGAPDGTAVRIRGAFRRRYAGRTGVALYHGGRFRLLLKLQKSQRLQFYYGAGRSLQLVSIAVNIARRPAPLRVTRHPASAPRRRNQVANAPR